MPFTITCEKLSIDRVPLLHNRGLLKPKGIRRAFSWVKQNPLRHCGTPTIECSQHVGDYFLVINYFDQAQLPIRRKELST